jgi:hypothetical protein
LHPWTDAARRRTASGSNFQSFLVIIVCTAMDRRRKRGCRSSSEGTGWHFQSWGFGWSSSLEHKSPIAPTRKMWNVGVKCRSTVCLVPIDKGVWANDRADFSCSENISFYISRIIIF